MGVCVCPVSERRSGSDPAVVGVKARESASVMRALHVHVCLMTLSKGNKKTVCVYLGRPLSWVWYIMKCTLSLDLWYVLYIFRECGSMQRGSFCMRELH